ncbi:MAG: hypothetical protein WHS86_00535 [Desulfosoma sp.]
MIKTIRRMGWVVPALCLLSSAAFAGVVVQPQGAVSLLENGREVRRIQSAFPLSGDQVVLCEGRCFVQMPGVQFGAWDKSVFAVAERSEGWDVMLRTGRLDFALRSDAKPVAFRTPHDVLEVQEVIAQASSPGVVRGTLTVTDKETRLAVHEGTLRVSAGGGSHRVGPGYALQLAQAQVTPPAAGAPGGAGAPAGAKVEDSHTKGLLSLGLGAAAALTTAAVVAQNNGEGGAGPTAPEETVPPEAKPKPPTPIVPPAPVSPAAPAGLQ